MRLKTAIDKKSTRLSGNLNYLNYPWFQEHRKIGNLNAFIEEDLVKVKDESRFRAQC